MTQRSWILFHKDGDVKETNKEHIEQEFIQGILECQKLFYDMLISVCFYGRN